ncbi:MAG: hypothetical protein JKY20_05280, partial [Alphaproteobacteria bacterium]|nr:hypothetical protein [Alphaproteobacteria bacterium]
MKVGKIENGLLEYFESSDLARPWGDSRLFSDTKKDSGALGARLGAIAFSAMLLSGSVVLASGEDGGPTKMSPAAKPTQLESGAFGPDPTYPDKTYDAKEQIKIYGGKSASPTPRPLIELGTPIYVEGPLQDPINVIGRKNLVMPAFNVSGDWRTTVSFSDSGNKEVARIATDINLDIDLKLTATERVHTQIEPFEQGGQFLNYQFAGDDRDQGNGTFDVNISKMFFEGDVGSIYAGLADEYTGLDLPFSFGLMPLFFQNGIWLDDAFVGGAFAIPALNSPILDISNMDISFFGGFDKVTTPGIRDAQGNLADHGVNIYGVTAFIERKEG